MTLKWRRLSCPKCGRFLANYTPIPGVGLETNCGSCKRVVVRREDGEVHSAEKKPKSFDSGSKTL